MPLSGMTPIEECLHWNRFDLVCLDAAIALTPGRAVAVQAGGNLGMFAGNLAEQFAAVYTFEPDASLFPMLVANAPQENIVRFQAALGDVPAFIGMQKTTPYDTHAGVAHVSGAGITPTMRIDDLRLPACDLLYLDIEGYELFALQGAVETLKAHKPTVAVEINRCCHRYGYSEGDIAALLKGLGYEHRKHIHNDHIWTVS